MMLPHDAAQRTAAFALNCCVKPAGVAALDGVITSGDVTIATVDAKLPVEDVAVTVQEAGIKGAVNNPAVEMVPQEAAKVALLLVVNCTVPPSLTVGFSGEMANEEAAETLSYP